MNALYRCVILVVVYGVVGIALGGGQAPWNGEVRHWGTMLEVLGQGQTQARVRIGDATPSADVVAVGALEGLKGEITIVDGNVWIARDAQGAEAIDAAESDASAALLISARVPEWRTVTIKKPIQAEEFETFLRRSAGNAGIDTKRPFPFVLEAALSVDAHVVRGNCPHAAASGEEKRLEPERFSIRGRRATLVGFFAEGSEGILTHHGAATHVHVVLPGEPSLMGHVDSVTEVHDGVLRLPKTKR